MPRMLVKDPLKAQGFRTQRAELPEDLWQPLYDRVNVATSVPSQVSFFSVPKGQSATLITGTAAASKTKTYRDTNMENANVVPTKMFKFIGVSIAFVHATRNAAANAQDRDYIRDGGWFEFKIVDKPLLYVPIIALPELNPYVAVSTTATATTINSAAGGGGSNVPMYKFPIPITLNPYENFSVTMNFDGTITLGVTLDIILVLQGYMRRPT